jgi:Zn-dependent M28 family amino/carboxypeptidase
MLTCAEKLLGQLPEDVELQLVGTGAEEVGCRGMRGFVDRHSDWSPESTYFVNFECVGGGLLHFIRSEGVLEKVQFPPMLLELARRVAASGAFGEVTPTDLLASTDGHVPAEQGYPSLSLISLDPNGVPRNYHRIEDTVDGIDTAMVVRAADFGAAVTMAALRTEAGPIADVIR